MDDVSAESVYEESQDHQQPPGAMLPDMSTNGRLPPAPHHPAHEHFHPSKLALGSAVNQDNLLLPPETMSLQEAASPRRAGSAMVDVGNGIGIPSMHGSVGFFPTQSMISDGGSQVSAAPPVPAPRVGSARTKISVAN
jgi:hypothetical protein